MRLLLDNAFAPITSTIGFLETDIATAVSAFWKWQQELLPQGSPGTRLEQRDLRGPLGEVLKGLLPLISHSPCRFLFVATNSPWVACFDNGWRGSDPISIVSYLNTRIGCRGLLVQATNDSLDPGLPEWQRRYAAASFALFGPELVNYRNTIRGVSVLHEGDKWTFREEGKPLPFEDTKQYESVRVKDRLTLGMLENYLRAIGLDPFEASFYLPAGQTAVLISKEGPLPPDVKTITPDFKQ
jgi:hypothetical protein